MQLFYQIALHGRRDLPLSPDPRGGFEMTLLRMLAFEPLREEAQEEGKGLSPPVREVRASRAGRDAGPRPAVVDPAAITPESWSALVNELGVSGLARELAVNCEPTGQDGLALRMRLAPNHEQLMAVRTREQLEGALETRLGVALKLNIELAAPKEDTPVQREQRRDSERRRAAVAAIENDATVRAICETFGTEVDPRLVDPVD